MNEGKSLKRGQSDSEQAGGRRHFAGEDARVDEVGLESFPASDAPAWWGGIKDPCLLRRERSAPNIPQQLESGLRKSRGVGGGGLSHSRCCDKKKEAMLLRGKHRLVSCTSIWSAGLGLEPPERVFFLPPHGPLLGAMLPHRLRN